MKSKYVCGNCGKTDAAHIRAMIKAGFRVDQQACRHCGQQAIRERGGTMTAKHTPGPWILHQMKNGFCITGSMSNGLNFVSYLMDQSEAIAIKSADARLIAAAPDLLAISHRLHMEINGLNKTLRSCDARYEVSILCQRLSELIRDNAEVLKKAMGEQ